MKSFLVLSAMVFSLIFLPGCTYNISMAHTSGTADDVIDDTASNSPVVSPTVTVPLTPGSSVQVQK